MGKKGDRKRKITEVDVEEREEEHQANELEAELAALSAMKAEKYNKTREVGQESDDEEEIGYGGKKRKVIPYNKDGLLKAFEGMGTTALPFVESLQVCSFGIAIEDDNDDLEREVGVVFHFVQFHSFHFRICHCYCGLQMAFYSQTILAVKEARTRLEMLGVPTRRPNDFFCENVKSDSHMNRVCD